MSKKTPTLKTPTSFASVFARFHGIIFTVVIVIGLSVAVFILYQLVLSSENADNYTPPSTDTSFDSTTLNKIDDLTKPGDTPVPLAFPSGRIDPFAE